MIALDTNVVVRYLVDDDETQSRQAADLMEGAAARGEHLFVGDLVLCETVWVLASSYGFSREEISGVLTSLLRARALLFSSTDRLARALAAYREGRGDFADYLIREHTRAAGAETVATFDRKLLGDPGFTAVRGASPR